MGREKVYQQYFEDENFFDINTQDDSETLKNDASAILTKLKAAKFKAVEKTLSEEQKEAEQE